MIFGISDAENIFKAIGIKPKYNKSKSLHGNSSRLRITKKAEVISFLNWIHHDVEFGLKRKRFDETMERVWQR